MSIDKITDALLILCDRCSGKSGLLRSLVMLDNSEKECDRCLREGAIVGRKGDRFVKEVQSGIVVMRSHSRFAQMWAITFVHQNGFVAQLY